jgi:tRNA 2-selenouridine synthase
MTAKRVSAREAIERLSDFHAVLDARSPSEFALDHLPRADNWPVLSDEERRIVGTEYVQISALEARKRGAAMVARNIADHLDRWVHDKPKGWRPLVYCWRGGQRSGTLAWFLDQIGFPTAVIDGGYKAFRHLVMEDLVSAPPRFRWRVLCGRTGSGKTRLLHALARQGAQVLDLEGLARHRGSVLGLLPDQPQPSQKHFDSLVWQALRGFDPQRPVYVEGESRKIGLLRVPERLIDRMQADGEVLRVETPDDARLGLLLEDYGFFGEQVEVFCRQIGALTELRGRQQVQAWQAAGREGRWGEVFMDLAHRHYDPIYLKSMAQTFAGFARAREVTLSDLSEATLDATAARLVADDGRP